MSEKKKKAAVLFSGGLDSTVLLYWVNKYQKIDWEDIIAINISYGQKHNKETKVAYLLSHELGFPTIHLDLQYIFQFAQGHSVSTLLKGGDDIPTGTYVEQGELPTTYVPFRNGLFISSAASVAIQQGAGMLFYGAHQDDARAAYPDCTEEFFEMMASAVWFGSGQEIKLLAPFIEHDKAFIVSEGLHLGVPFERTWSCYNGGEHPCGECATCIDRAKAFEKNGKVDPLLLLKDMTPNV